VAARPGPDSPCATRPDGPPRRHDRRKLVLTLQHASGVHSHLSASRLNRSVAREFRVYGDTGSYVASGTDVQAQAIFAGLRPADDPAGWGLEKRELWGTLRTAEGAERIPSEQGALPRLLRGVRASRGAGRPAPGKCGRGNPDPGRARCRIGSSASY
jgi:hypothetical protein